MIYRTNQKNGDKLSQLGFGCMRFPKSDDELLEIISYAIENGVNYFDTAYVYGNSEERLGACLKKLNAREKVKIATKLPPWKCKSYEDFDKLFETSLKRLQTDYIDYYFIHSLGDLSGWQRMKNFGVLKWIDEKKSQGKIKNIGFSYHGGKEEYLRICDAYNWEFSMIQYNYLDENNQAGKSGLHYAVSKGLTVMVMGPARGGMLAGKLPKDAITTFEEAYIKRSPAEWAFRWVYNQPEVTCVLSGMSNMKMLEENIEVASTANAGDFTDDDFEVINNARKALTKAIKIPCTGCSYCMPCPQGVDIPSCLSSYNDIFIDGKVRAFQSYLQQTSMKTNPQMASNCNACGKCEPLCPQKIEIRAELSKVSKTFEKFYFKLILFFVKRFMKL